jgi:hypothetical protein
VDLRSVLDGVLLVLGAGFLVANLRLLLQYVTFMRRRSAALLTWPSPKPPYFALALAMGAALALVVVAKLLVRQTRVFGEMMMVVYYAGLTPLGRRIRRGFYEDGIWTDSGFIPYNEIGGISWREGEHEVTLFVISRLRNLARRLTVPLDNYGAARKVLREKIARHDIHFTGTGLDLGEHDEREDV